MIWPADVRRRREGDRREAYRAIDGTAVVGMHMCSRCGGAVGAYRIHNCPARAEAVAELQRAFAAANLPKWSGPMSWSVAIPKTPKPEVAAVIEALTLPPGEWSDTEPHRAQLATAKAMALLAIETIPGPFISGYLNGHGNGVGEQSKPGMANDCVTVSVNQQVE